MVRIKKQKIPNMFTGIVETVAKVIDISTKGSNRTLTLQSEISNELKIDQSLCHNGVCLTVEQVTQNQYTVTAIEETLNRSNIGNLLVGDSVNLERCLPINGRLDGHIVQGHVDQKGRIKSIDNKEGSWEIHVEYEPTYNNITVEKGSICMNGVSLTVVDSNNDGFSVAIIPYTWEHTNFQYLKPGDEVNLEFDILGKYIQKLHLKQ